MCVYVCVCVREKERERERNSVRECILFERESEIVCVLCERK